MVWNDDTFVGDSGHMLSDLKHRLFRMTFGLLFQLHFLCFLLGKIRVTGFFVMLCFSSWFVCLFCGGMDEF